MQGTNTATVLVGVGVGSKYETRKIKGISHFLEHMTFKGTKQRPSALQIANELDGVGGDYNAFTSREYTYYYARVPSPHLELALDIEADILLNSLFDKEELEREKGVIIEEINMIKDDPPRHLWDVYEELLYNDQPAGWDTAGTKETVAKLTRQDLISYFRDYYVGPNLTVVITGTFKPERVLQKINDYFKAVATRPIKPKPRVREAQTQAQFKHVVKQTDQTHLRVGVRGYSLNHSDKYVFLVLAALLGSGMSSRMWTAVRERKGLAYYVYSEVEQYTDTGYLVTQAGVNNQKVEEACSAILNEYQKIKEKKVNDKELKKTKEGIKGRLLMRLENSANMASFLGLQHILTKKTMTSREKIDKIDAVGPDDIQRVAQDIFRSNTLNAALIGPKRSEEPLLKMLKQAFQ